MKEVTSKEEPMIRGLKDWIARVEEMGELKTFSRVSDVLEIGALTTLALEKGRGYSPALLFENIPGYSPDYRILTSPLHSPERVALSAGSIVEAGQSKLEQARLWKNYLAAPRLIPPVRVDGGPVLQNRLLEDEVDLTLLPAPVWHEIDRGRRYLGTGSVTILKDPETGRVNLGTYRVMVHDRNTVGFYMRQGCHGYQIRQKYFEKGLPCPVVISLGHDPLLFMASGMPLPPTISEYDFAGGLRGAPVEVIEGECTGLPIPAWSEIVLEGESYPGELLPEGPFGEFTGYCAGGEKPEPYIKVKRIYHQDRPVLQGAPPVRPPFTDVGIHYHAVGSAIAWGDLERTGLTDIRGVWAHEAAQPAQFLVISLKQRYAGHAAQVAFTASQILKNFGRFVVTVDEDIDPSNLDDVLWALVMRCDPADDIDIIRRCWSSRLDPIMAAKNKAFSSRAIVDACIPFDLKETFPPPIGVSQELRAQVSEYAKIL